jgi:hypothetical protein
MCKKGYTLTTDEGCTGMLWLTLAWIKEFLIGMWSD